MVAYRRQNEGWRENLIRFYFLLCEFHARIFAIWNPSPNRRVATVPKIHKAFVWSPIGDRMEIYMSSICGIFAPTGLWPEDDTLATRMNDTLAHRGRVGVMHYTDSICALRQNTSLVEMQNEREAITQLTHQNHTYTLVYNGEIYNKKELASALAEADDSFAPSGIGEQLLMAYALWREEMVMHIDGMFAFAIYDHTRQTLFCARDRIGIKPFYFSQMGRRFLFASECKALLSTGAVPAVVDRLGVWQLLFLAPVTLPGKSIYAHIESLRPGECATISEDGMVRKLYWQLPTYQIKENEADIVAHTEALLVESIGTHAQADLPVASLLSGGLDSSIVSSVASAKMKEQGKALATFSFAYENNHYAPTLFQPEPDDAYAALMARSLGTQHKELIIPTQNVASTLADATYARDFPGQADIDSSLLWFFRQIKPTHEVVLSGEGADEVFGGYPWFYRPEMLARNYFPFIHNPFGRVRLFSDNFSREAEGYAYFSECYSKTVAEVVLPDWEDTSSHTARVAGQLTMQYFMASLLERKDRMSMATGVEARLPFGNYKLVEYVYNIPWSIKYKDQTEKALLRNAMAKWLPDAIRLRKKSPYPKTHNPQYEALVYHMLEERLARPESPLRPYLNPAAYQALKDGADETWFGQLMARAQLYAWLYQLDVWMEAYHIQFRL